MIGKKKWYKVMCAAGWRCANCGRDKSAKLTIDHIRPISKGGATVAYANLQVLCFSCNMKKRDKWDGYSGWPRGDVIKPPKHPRACSWVPDVEKRLLEDDRSYVKLARYFRKLEKRSRNDHPV